MASSTRRAVRRVPSRARTAVAVALVLAAACTGEPALPDWVTATAVPAVPEMAATPSAAVPGVDLGPDLRVVDVPPGTGPVVFDTGAGDRSWAIAVTAAEPDGLVGVARVTDPDGEVRYAADLRRERVLVDELDQRVLADAGAIGLYVVPPRDVPLPAGRWTVEVVGNDGPPAVRVVVRDGDPVAPQQLDLAVWATAPDVDVAAVEARWRAAADASLGPHDVAVGVLDVVVAGAAGEPFRSIGIDGLAPDVHAACDAAHAALEPDPRTAVVVLVDRIGEGILSAAAPSPTAASGAAVRRPEADIDGYVAATPGTPVLGPTSHACAVVAARGDAPARGHVALHEVLHLAGLVEHTTERDGRRFDRLPDTPECPAAEFDRDRDGQVSRIECADADAPNLMFWAAGGTELTADQAWRVRAHPLVKPAG